MKLKEIFYLLGFKPKVKTYGHRIDRFQLDRDGEIEFANWEHPVCEPKSVTQANLDALRKFLKPGDTAIDIGAHVGDTTVPVALAVGSEGCVFGFEPNPSVFEILKVNARLNPEKMRIEALPYAASESACKLKFTYSDSGLCNGGEHKGVSRWRHAHAFEIEVDGLNAEKLLRDQYPEEIQKLRYVKTDAEGADLYVLRSIKGLIEEFRPYVRSEVYKHTSPEQRRELFQFFLNFGYSIFEYESSENFQGKRLGIDDVIHADHYDIFAVPPESE
tara:strand:- start:445 stop:1266 length:822 start_codon:yes stop_codon:yes gene_type:complete